MRLPLTDCFLPILETIEKLRLIEKPGDADISQLVRGLTRQLDQAAETASNNHHKHEDTDLARFAVCSWADEVLMLLADRCSTERYHSSPLQRSYYDTSEAGVQFYKKLYESALDRPEALAVFRLCMMLGFRGLRYTSIPSSIRLNPAAPDTAISGLMTPVLSDLNRCYRWRRLMMRMIPWLLIPVMWLITDGLLSRHFGDILWR